MREPEKDRDMDEQREYREFIPLKNPLPAPPRRSHIRMEFDLADPGEDDFDLEIGDEDDFDI